MNILAVTTLLLLWCCVYCAQCKECPAATKAHATRCDLYYKCLVLATAAQVWIPSKCDRGLVYEPSLELCVLPADDWECSLGDADEAIPVADDQRNVFVRNDLQHLKHTIDTYTPTFHDSAANVSPDNVDVVDDFADKVADASDEDEDDNDASGDCGLDNCEDESPVQLKSTTTYQAVPAPSVASHLQRLTQLIQSMAQAQQQQTQQSPNGARNHSQELGPNDLNAFLAHHDIQSGVRTKLLTADQRKQSVLSEGGRIPSQHLAEILRLQAQIQRQNGVDSVPDHRDRRPVQTAQDTPNAAASQQIIVNRPGGSVLFSLPPAAHRPVASEAHDPQTISEDTLKTMLELSKQLLSSSSQAANNPPRPYGQLPYYRPVYYSIPVDSDYPAEYERQPQQQTLYGQHPSPSAADRSPIIHNHIPITIQNRKAASTGAAHNSQGGSSTTTETRYDSFGGKVVTTYPSGADVAASDTAYPPYPVDQLTAASKTEQSQQQYSPFVAAIPENFYPTTPHLADQNVNSHVNVITPAYPTLRPTAAGAYSHQHQMQMMPADLVSSQSMYPSQVYASNRPHRPQPQSSQISDAISGSYQQQQQQHHRPIDPNTAQMYDEDVDDADDGDRDNVDAAENEAVPNNHNNVMSALPATRPNFGAANRFGTQPNSIVHYGDTYLPYADFQLSVAPLLNAAARDRVEVLSCVTGARQPSSADCAKYFVCNASTGKVMTYVCPQYTAFNQATRFCDARSYAECKAAGGIGGGGSGVSGDGDSDSVIAKRTSATIESNRIQQQLEQSQQSQAAAFQVFASNINNNVDATRPVMLRDETPPLQQQQQQRPHRRRQPRPTANSQRKVLPTARPRTTTTSTTPEPPPPPPAPSTPPKRAKKPAAPMKRRIQCTEPTKVRDSLSVYNYFSCFKGADGQLKAIKQTCPNGLVFCASTRVCTSKDRCKGQKMH